MLALIERRGLAVPFPIEVRFAAADDAFLSARPTAAKRLRRRAHVRAAWSSEPYFRGCRGDHGRLGGRPHWGKRHFQTAATLRSRYPTGIASRPCARAWTPAACSPTTRPIACSARRAWTGAPLSSPPRSACSATRAAFAGLRGAVRVRRPRRVVGERRRHARRAAGKPIRVASKSLRCRALLERDPRSATPASGACSRSRCPRRCGSPSTGSTTSSSPTRRPTATALRALAARDRRATRTARRCVMVDCVEHLDLIEARGRRRRGAGARVHRRRRRAAGSRGGRVKIGPKRSPIHTPEQAAALAPSDRARGRACALVGMMAYEGQIAGVGDRAAGPAAARARDRARMQRALRARAARAPRARPSRAVAAGAPSWSSSTAAAPAASSATAAEPAMTEVAAGSGFYAPDAVRPLRALHAAARRDVRAARRRGGRGAASSPRSAAATSPPAPAPRTACPARTSRPACASTALEGAGEVQTPLLRRGRRPPARRRPRLLPPRQGRRAVRALQPACYLLEGDADRRRGAHLPRRGQELPVTCARPRFAVIVAA